MNNSSFQYLHNEESSTLHAQIQADEQEKQIEQKNEALTKVDSLHWELESLWNRIGKQKKLRDIRENDFDRNLKEELPEKIGVAQKILIKKERVLARIKDLENGLRI